MPVTVMRRLLTVEEYEQMYEFGILGHEENVELIRGEIVKRMTAGDPHIACVNRLNRLFMRALDDDVIVSVQNPFRLPDSMPEPDLTLLRPRTDFYSTRKAQASDIYLVVEVADSSIDFDREVKLPLYAENGVAEYWIANLNDDSLEVYRQPKADGSYAQFEVLRPGQTVEIAGLPGAAFAVSQMF